MEYTELTDPLEIFSNVCKFTTRMREMMFMRLIDMGVNPLQIDGEGVLLGDEVFQNLKKMWNDSVNQEAKMINDVLHGVVHE